MFGLENKKSDDTPSEFVFDLEKDLKDQKKNRELKKLTEERIQKIKTTLRSGSVKDEFDQYGVLLHGYTSLLKVLMRFKTT
ncbi:MAG: DUF5398 domain-containing protein [Chlamydiota bacterium]